MDFLDKQYVIGIDLGTTNSAVSYVDMAALKKTIEETRQTPDKDSVIKAFNIPQLTGLGELTKIFVLPSFLYIPGEYDISKEVLKHPWTKREDLFVGSFARDHGSKIPSRLVSSAKSWLCNPGVDRQAKILPWGSPAGEKVSPVTATAEYLGHIRSAWNHFVKDEDRFLENQFVVITVPASFNEEARDLTMEAVKTAGFGNSVTLLEEPLAAFYSWLIRHESDWHTQVGEGELILVCDVGGGTTDVSLITLKSTDGSPRFERVAVGDHLILGGDNIDLALAKIVENKFQSKDSISPDKWKTLCHRCREAKEKILEQNENSVRITLKGEGRALIAGTLSADLTKSDVEGVLCDKFFADVTTTQFVENEAGKQIADFGLPFEKESSVTKHIINFLEKHKDTVKDILGKDSPMPDFILFNGGTLKPVLVQSRIKEAIRKWFKTPVPEKPIILDNDRPELAVGIGASYYGLVKQGIGVRVGSGSPRSYYLGIATDQGEARQAVCLVERGLDEGSVIDLTNLSFEVRTNQPVSFDVYSSSFRSGDVAGNVIRVDDSLSAMAPLQTIIKFGKKAEKKQLPVTMGAEYTEMGSLVMFCRSAVSDHQWKLQFQLRNVSEVSAALENEVYDDALINDAGNLIEQAFSKERDDALLNSIVKSVEKLVAQGKANWPLSFLRQLADKLIEISQVRTLSAAHESRWLNLTGFCMRPGFGDAFDQERIRQLWTIYLKRLTFDNTPQNNLEWWIFIRRIAGGLKAGQQRQFFQDTSGLLIKPGKQKMTHQELTELWMTCANMERLLVKDKVVLAKALIKVIRPGKKMGRHLWSLSRLGARQLLYGSQDRVVPAAEVTRWIHQLMKKEWAQDDQVDSLIVALARKTGDRTRDLAADVQEEIITWLGERGADLVYICQVRERTEMGMKEKNMQFGERLPSGLVLL